MVENVTEATKLARDNANSTRERSTRFESPGAISNFSARPISSPTWKQRRAARSKIKNFRLESRRGKLGPGSNGVAAVQGHTAEIKQRKREGDVGGFCALSPLRLHDRFRFTSNRVARTWRTAKGALAWQNRGKPVEQQDGWGSSAGKHQPYDQRRCCRGKEIKTTRATWPLCEIYDLSNNFASLSLFLSRNPSNYEQIENSWETVCAIKQIGFVRKHRVSFVPTTIVSSDSKREKELRILTLKPLRKRWRIAASFGRSEIKEISQRRRTDCLIDKKIPGPGRDDFPRETRNSSARWGGWEFLSEASVPFAPSYRHNRESSVAGEQLGHS